MTESAKELFCCIPHQELNCANCGLIVIERLIEFYKNYNSEQDKTEPDEDERDYLQERKERSSGIIKDWVARRWGFRTEDTNHNENQLNIENNGQQEVSTPRVTCNDHDINSRCENCTKLW